MALYLYPPTPISVTIPPTSFIRDGVITSVLEDTGTPANDRPLPVKFSTGSPIPVTGPLTDAELRATPVPVSGTVTATGPLTDTELRATPVPVSGTVTASGPLTDTELRATPVPISGTVTANTGLTQPLTNTELRATAVPVSGPLTDTELRATAVPVSGTVTATGPLTDTELRATPVPVSSAPAILNGGISSAQITVGTTAIRATHDGNAPSANRRKLIIKPSKTNTGNIFLGGSGVTTSNGLEIIGPDRLVFENDISEYYLRSNVAGQTVEILEVILP